MLVLVFVANGTASIITLNNNRELSEYVYTVTNPSLQSLQEYKDIIIESKLYTTNWVFLRSNQVDKTALKQIHDIEYPLVKSKLDLLSRKWDNKDIRDSLNKIFTRFEAVIAVQKGIMSSLGNSKDYDDPVTKYTAEQLVEKKLNPINSSLRAALSGIISYNLNIRNNKNADLEKSFMHLRMLISFLAFTIIFIGIFLSIYMTRLIISPVNKIKQIINDLGNGIIRKIDHTLGNDEIGEMVHSVNNLSEKLQSTAAFAIEIGNRNFDTHFEPLSKRDTLGKALLAMRDNLKTSEAKLLDVNKELTTLFNSIDEIFFSVNMVTLKVIQISATCERINGYSQAEFMDNHELWFQLIHPDDKYVIEKEGAQLRRGEQVNNQYRVICKDQRIIWVETKITPTLNEEGVLLRVDGVTSDITERKKSELANKFKADLLNTIGQAVLATDLNGTISFWNKAAEEIYGYTEEEAIGQNVVELTPAQQTKEQASEIMTELLKGHAWSGEFKVQRKNGESFNAFVTDAPIYDEHGKLSGIIGVSSDITLRKKGEEDLIQSEQYNRNLFNQSPIGLALSRMDGTLADVNEAFAKIIGHTIEECKTLSYYSINSNKYIEQELDKLQELETTGKFGPYEKEYLHKNGHLVPVMLSGTMIERDGATYILSSVEDITKRKEVETVLKNSESQLAIAMRIAKLGYWEFDVVNGVFKFDEQFYSLFKTNGEENGGYTMEPGRYAEVFLYPEDQPLVEYEINDALTNPNAESHRRLEHRFLYSTGEIGWMSVNFYIVKDTNGRTIKTFGVNQDITEQKSAEAQLHRSEKQYRQIVETAQEGIWMIDENNDTTFINKKMCEIIEYDTEQIIGKKMHSFMDEEANKNAPEQIERRRKGLSETHDSVFVTKTGKHVCTSLSTNPIFDHMGKYKGALAMITDITTRKHHEELLKKSQANLAANNRQLEIKNKELEQFAYVASHDLQEPLRTTISFVDIFKKQYFDKLDPKARKYLNYIAQASERMRVLIKDLLDFSRIGHNKDLEPVDCNKIFKDVIQDIKIAVTESNAIITAGKLPVISGYPTEITQLFQNLIMNAIKFRKPGESPRIKIAAGNENDQWCFAFNDNGIGINKHHFERIFIIFQRLHSRTEYQGSGIGLSHCKKIVELHHGKIWVESVPGEGSTFCFSIPMHQPVNKLQDTDNVDVYKPTEASTMN